METLIKLNDELSGAPAGVLIVIFSICLGYLVRGLECINNKWIPLIVVSFSTVSFVMLAPDHAADVPHRIWLARNFIIGFILGFAAWAAHKLVLANIEDKIPGLKQWINSNEPTEPPKL